MKPFFKLDTTRKQIYRTEYAFKTTRNLKVWRWIIHLGCVVNASVIFFIRAEITASNPAIKWLAVQMKSSCQQTTREVHEDNVFIVS